MDGREETRRGTQERHRGVVHSSLSWVLDRTRPSTTPPKAAMCGPPVQRRRGRRPKSAEDATETRYCDRMRESWFEHARHSLDACSSTRCHPFASVASPLLQRSTQDHHLHIPIMALQKQGIHALNAYLKIIAQSTLHMWTMPRAACVSGVCNCQFAGRHKAQSCACAKRSREKRS